MTGDSGKAGGESSFSATNIMSPYFLSPSDNPAQLHVPELLRDDNYADWANEMTNSLFAKNKIGFVNRKLPMPKEGSQELDY